MTIRSRLLTLLLPLLISFLILVSWFFYFNWSQEILNSFKSGLQSIVVTTSQAIQPDEVEWLIQHIHDPDLETLPQYQMYHRNLNSLRKKLPLTNIYIVQVVPVREGEYVLPEHPEHPLNEVYAGHDSLNAYRQVMLLGSDPNQNGPLIKPGESDFSESDERQVYLTKKALVTPIYETRKTHERLISAYAPILNKKGEVIALLGADVDIKEIDHKLNKALLVIIIGGCITLLFVILTVFLIADRISKPVRQLNQAALGIAAGNYETNIQVQGPKEIVELANTLNTMSECLVEHMSRLQESSLVRERMYGEYECALLLQHYMLQKNIEDFNNLNIRMRLISAPHSPLQNGLLLKIDRTPPADLMLTLLEAQEPGFGGLFRLNQIAGLENEQIQDEAFIECQFYNHYTKLRCRHHQLAPPLVWSMKSQQFLKVDQTDIQVQNQDMLFLYNSCVIEQFETEEAIQSWFGRVLRHFSEDGLDTIHTMLTNELNFLAKKQQVKRNFQVLVIQIKLPEPPK